MIFKNVFLKMCLKEEMNNLFWINYYFSCIFFFLRFNFFSASESFFGFKPFFPVSDLLLWFCVVGVYQGVDAAALSHLLQVKNSLHHLSFSGCCWHQPTGTKHSFSYYHIMEYIDKLMFVTYWYTLRSKIK